MCNKVFNFEFLEKFRHCVFPYIFAFSALLCPFWTNFDGELEAIRVATKQIIVRIAQLKT